MKEALESGKLGEIHMVNCSVLWNRNMEYYSESDWRGSKLKEGGALYTQASHFIDLLVWCFGEIVEAKLTTGNVHDTKPVLALARNLKGKLYADKGYISKKLTVGLKPPCLYSEVLRDEGSFGASTVLGVGRGGEGGHTKPHPRSVCHLSCVPCVI